MLALGLVALAASNLWQRGRAAWQLHGRATTFADYALCMVGPTGPALLREGAPEYTALLRRRVLEAPAKSRPFEGCVRFVERLELDAEQSALHQLEAASFGEFWDEAGAGHALSELNVSAALLSELAERAWPFVRGDYAKLVEPAQHAVEAPHTTQPGSPGVGAGLPVRRAPLRSTAAFGDRVVALLSEGQRELELVSDDGGVHFRAARHAMHSELSERCALDEEGKAFSFVERDQERYVLSQGGGAVPQLAFLAPTSRKLLTIACDRQGLVALLGPVEEGGAIGARHCAYRGRCSDFELPRLGERAADEGIDLARVGGDTVVSWVTGGIARVASSRDQGRSWTPWTVVFDRQSTNEARPLAPPTQLLAVGDRVLFYGGGARPKDTYHLLVSDDHGATFRAPR
ncbi:MAG TPA: hypothetical protein VLC09_06865 [Polyangiaceae bacterium]|nr:hypothetical protein [Polyangiaceae bacterium]